MSTGRLFAPRSNEYLLKLTGLRRQTSDRSWSVGCRSSRPRLEHYERNWGTCRAGVRGRWSLVSAIHAVVGSIYLRTQCADYKVSAQHASVAIRFWESTRRPRCYRLVADWWTEVPHQCCRVDRRRGDRSPWPQDTGFGRVWGHRGAHCWGTELRLGRVNELGRFRPVGMAQPRSTVSLDVEDRRRSQETAPGGAGVADGTGAQDTVARGGLGIATVRSWPNSAVGDWLKRPWAEVRRAYASTSTGLTGLAAWRRYGGAPYRYRLRPGDS